MLKFDRNEGNKCLFLLDYNIIYIIPFVLVEFKLKFHAKKLNITHRAIIWLEG